MKLKFAIAAALIGCLGSTTALADDNGFYGYISAGSSKTDRKAEVDTSITNIPVTAFTSSADSTSTSYKLQLGYQYNRNLAVEAGYVDIGKFTYHAVATVPAATRDGIVKLTGWNLDAVGRLPVSDAVTVFGKLGMVAYDLSFSCSGTGVACVSPDRSNSGTRLHYGLGLDWNLGKNMFARMEYEVYEKLGEALNTNGTTGTTRANASVAGIGIGYRL